MLTANALPQALHHLLTHLEADDYSFVTPTTSTHGRRLTDHVSARPYNLRDVFGWTLPFASGDLPDPLFAGLLAAGALMAVPGGWRSRFRVATMRSRLIVHSTPSSDPDAVFLGPDSYRFVRFLETALASGSEPVRIVDVGAGAGALAVAAIFPAADVVATDINSLALSLTEINARHTGAKIQTLVGPGLDPVAGPLDLVIANPPFIAGDMRRAYRDGGGHLGTGLALDWARQALGRLDPGGRMLLYTGSPVVEGEDMVLTALSELAAERGACLEYAELDPDILGGTLRQAAYASVERIAAVDAVITV